MHINEIFSVEGKKICITGAAGGIGSALVQAFIENGAHVLGVTRSSSAEWNEAITGSNKFIPFVSDFAREEDVFALLKFIQQEYSNIDVLVHGAWACPSSPQYSLENFRSAMTVGLEAAFILYGGIAPLMAKKNQGSIISIGSINGTMAFPNNPAYTSLKAALHLLTKTIALDFGEQGVRANNLRCGYVHTKMTDQSFADPTAHQSRKNRTMLKRWGSTSDIVGPCLFLASDASSYITGTDIFVDGGWTAKGL